ncbi:MAG: peptidoglycan DD-metalloendopeptidase family protein [Pseudomonadota bacterium]
MKIHTLGIFKNNITKIIVTLIPSVWILGCVTSQPISVERVQLAPEPQPIIYQSTELVALFNNQLQPADLSIASDRNSTANVPSQDNALTDENSGWVPITIGASKNRSEIKTSSTGDNENTTLNSQNESFNSSDSGQIDQSNLNPSTQSITQENAFLADQAIKNSADRSEGTNAHQNAYKTLNNDEKVIQKGYSGAALTTGTIEWLWPTDGSVISRFQEKQSKGIGISGQRGDEIRAAKDGTVVYAGDGVVGYGNLIIIQHNGEFLSAYGHSSKILVSEGQAVKVGQKIAEIGSSGTLNDKLHFEIRLRGTPVDPLKYVKPPSS